MEKGVEIIARFDISNKLTIEEYDKLVLLKNRMTLKPHT